MVVPPDLMGDSLRGEWRALDGLLDGRWTFNPPSGLFLIGTRAGGLAWIGYGGIKTPEADAPLVRVGVLGLGNLKLVKMACGMSTPPLCAFGGCSSAQKFTISKIPAESLAVTYGFVPNFDDAVLGRSSALPAEHAVQRERRRSGG